MAHLFPALTAEDRPTVDTATAAHYLNYSPQTLFYWSHKGCGPLQPQRIPGMRKLQWNTAEIRTLLGVGK